ncbi:alpha/beta fold hydrolase [Streptomyces antarcticus]|uniref:alpha/beta fold hydrolase n=1 Tax=Streptomyces antarcticus TaxID=2996458 RepID=UPI002271777F|nr:MULTISPECIES: alpha/beta hydrolase [unclassified Streptomyces]MCY0944479.1 alpha/beta hydrolase [Streptomyces sp. H34-AA3]MCY0952081.1 alpha/beta hydrolase [Streptomyces sp. H27-S2]MCZ4087016.1 alpha/beta hydrolase [Streptomyces sp. H34-S5]
MQLHTHTWGEGDRIALLIHGIMADHRTWRRVGPALADRGYRVIAVDLRGHGASPRGEYTAELYADDVAESLPAGAELAIGHSLGGLTLSLAVERLRPRRAVFSDPAWHLAPPVEGFGPEMLARFKYASREQIRAMNPRWEDADVDIEIGTLALWDESTALGLAPLLGTDLLPAAPVVPSLVQLSDPSTLISPERAAVLTSRGFEVRSVAGAGHTIHRDDFGAFMTSLEGWI